MIETLPFYRALPDGRKISSVSFGCSSIWAQPSFSERQAFEIVEAAVDGGINYFDTGPSYGAGMAECRLGRFLAGRAQDKILISTKVGTHASPTRGAWRSFKVTDMEQSFNESLSRLGLSKVDILYLHGPQISDLTDETFDFFERQKRSGRIVWSGVNSFDNKVIAHCMDLPVDAVMLQYNINDQSAANVLPELHERGKIVISGTALARAIYLPSVFWPSSRERLWYLLRALKTDPLFLIRGAQLRRKFLQVGDAGARAAIRYVVGNPYVHSATFGTSRVANLLANIDAGRYPMSSAQREIFNS
jgi:D-threo-aldose 1-dehydrogenase